VLATIAFALSLWKEIIRPVKLSFLATVEWGADSDWTEPNEALVFLTVTNSGFRKVTITKIVPIASDGKEGEVFKPPGLPSVLENGDATTIVCDIALAGEGWKRIEIEDSVGKRYQLDKALHSNIRKLAERFIRQIQLFRQLRGMEEVP
jgi:hypothetical protein